AGGDVFKFVELQEKVGFIDAVKILANRFGIPVPELEGGGDQRESAAEREQLASPAGAKWRDYLLKDRGLKQETIDQLQIGWAPPSRDALRQRLLKAGFNSSQLVTSGLVSRR